jgi:DNA-binding response OmpR family regulator
MAGALKKGLEAENHVVSLAFDGREGLELALSAEFDVLVLDLMLPGMDGRQPAAVLRKSLRYQVHILVAALKIGVARCAS